MCGILGIISSGGSDVATAAAALTKIRHRGPDDEGLLLADWRSGEHAPVLSRDSDQRLRLPHWNTLPERPWPLILGHRRLSILDLSEAGHQPMSWRNGRYWITYNGEVYNYAELRSELETLGCRFESGSDTEVILAAYEAWGADCVLRFTGMWAFAIWDVKSRVVFISRDPFGIKPLYYSGADGKLSFCSEIKGLLELPWISRRIHPQAAYQYLAWGRTENPDGATMLEAVREMPPATRATVNLDGPLELRPERYWNLTISAPRRIPLEEAAAEFRELFLESTRLHLRADVPVGAALSGGIDSTSIVCAMRQTAGPDLDLHTFSYLADDPQLNEEKWMCIAAGASGAHRHTVAAAAGDLERDLDTLILCQDLPFSTTSIYAQHCVFRLVKETGIKVTLDGQGPDEMFGGYLYFRRDRARSLLARGDWRAAFRMAKLAGANPWKLLGQSLAPRFLSGTLRRTFGRDPAPPWLNKVWLRQAGVDASFPMPELPRSEALRHSLRRALLETGIPSLLRFEDRNSMHFSVESRVPFLTTKLAEAALSLPEELLIAEDGTTKRVLRSSFRGLVPDGILDRRDKIGFATPEESWLRDRATWVRSVIDSPEARAIPAFSHGELMPGGHAREDFPVWRVLNFIRWSTLNRADFS